MSMQMFRSSHRGFPQRFDNALICVKYITALTSQRMTLMWNHFSLRDGMMALTLILRSEMRLPFFTWAFKWIECGKNSDYIVISLADRLWNTICSHNIYTQYCHSMGKSQNRGEGQFLHLFAFFLIISSELESGHLLSLCNSSWSHLLLVTIGSNQLLLTVLLPSKIISVEFSINAA